MIKLNNLDLCYVYCYILRFDVNTLQYTDTVNSLQFMVCVMEKR